MSHQQVWFVTGASKGLGLSLVKRLLAEGYKVAATSRNRSELQEAVGTHHSFLPLETDLTSESSVATAIKETIDRFDRLDAVVNNAGYGLLGALEELSMEAIRQEFEINVFATFNVIRQALPQLRYQRSGYIFNITSIAGWHGDQGANVYNSSKYAVEGLSDALAKDLKPFNIKVIAVAPGPFRTNFLGKGSVMYAEPTIDDYAHIHQHKQWLDNNLNGKQLGDPEKAPDVIIRLFNEANPPTHIIMGSDGVQVVTNHLTNMLQEIDKWKTVSISTDLNEK
ncbi:SDR family NAD(P)-dependent oxidoreductase [Spirosoma foliorum]|uniref:SDR family NAD(P)-dependent oxidoreductase n=1 Tax=Spirosoma foliorum TaxID=2710596 RepID=A0A7G5GVB5_9BACT|nr:SDR family NAD(P)-dependent oxidoreductase [Spirosoma foliorum]QMW02807.1 SDR family NAD(P)-dependent oxidoreductase [Spirosoma foliorum]